MTIKRRDLIAAGAAGTMLALAGVASAQPIASGQGGSLPSARDQDRMDEGTVRWLSDLREDFEALGFSPSIVEITMRLNTLMIGNGSDVLPTDRRFRVSDADPELCQVTMESYDSYWSLIIAKSGLLTDDQMIAPGAQGAIENLADAALAELRVRKDRLREQGWDMLPSVPIRPAVIAADPRTFQPVQRFATLFAKVPYEVPSN